ncbi:MAG: hemerythrin domain-containing protein [Gallionella sp.]|jgi:iron-sulfur cluster repair protein YtfE (RIC family)
MNTLTEFMSTDHKACDAAFALAEEAALIKDWNSADHAFNTLRREIARHFSMEETVLFPALQDAGGPAGPVNVMLMEHAQMNDLLEQMDAALQIKDERDYAGIAETLLIVMQQHNLKEEQILYPIADKLLASQRASLLSRMKCV